LPRTILTTNTQVHDHHNGRLHAWRT
jgi:hypothetical protein